MYLFGSSNLFGPRMIFYSSPSREVFLQYYDYAGCGRVALSSRANNGIDICSNRKLCGFKYAYYIVPLIDEPSTLQVSFDRLNFSVGIFRMRFGPS